MTQITTTVRVGSLAEAAKVTTQIARALENPQRVLRQMGAIVLADAQRAFVEQRLGDIPWKPRYPNQEPPYVNIAGVVADFAAGKKNPPDRRFQNRPVGIDTGLTRRQLTMSKAAMISGYEITLINRSPGAEKLQNGGESRQPITQQVKDSLADWMRRSRARVKRHQKKSTPTLASDAAAGKLGFLFREKTLVTESPERPFFGITDQTKDKLLRIAAGEFLPKAPQRRTPPQGVLGRIASWFRNLFGGQP